MHPCKFCQSTDYFKHGQVRGLQRYKCKTCTRNFTETALRGVPSKENKSYNVVCKWAFNESDCPIIWGQRSGGNEMDQNTGQFALP